MSALQDINSQEAASLWDVDGQLRIKLTCATYVNVRELGKVMVTLVFMLRFLGAGNIKNLLHSQVHKV